MYSIFLPFQTDMKSIPQELGPTPEDPEERYMIVVEENENLRIGMHEILEQLRNYEGCKFVNALLIFKINFL